MLVRLRARGPFCLQKNTYPPADHRLLSTETCMNGDFSTLLALHPSRAIMKQNWAESV